MATAKINTSRFLAKGNTNSNQRAGGVHVALPSGPGSSAYVKAGKKTDTVGGRMSGMSTSAKAKDC